MFVRCVRKFSFLLFSAHSLLAVSSVDQVTVYGGVFDLMREKYRTFELGAEYKFSTPWRCSVDSLYFRPVLGAMGNAHKNAYLYGGINFDFFVMDSLVIAPGFAAGWYGRGEGKDLGCPVEFRTLIEMAWQFRDQSRIGIRFYHLSNAGLGHKNPGEESLVLTYDIPMKKGLGFHNR